jgi:hypothetical protein
MNIRTFKAVLASSAVLALGLGANAAQAATATANAKVQILKAITVAKTADLDFGTVVTGASAGTVTLTAAGGFTCGTGLVCAGTAIPARFEVTGTALQFVTVSTGNATLLGPGVSMGAVLTASVPSFKLTGVAATDAFTVGGVLSVNAAQVEGSYSGSFTVNVNYQ